MVSTSALVGYQTVAADAAPIDHTKNSAPATALPSCLIIPIPMPSKLPCCLILAEICLIPAEINGTTQYGQRSALLLRSCQAKKKSPRTCMFRVRNFMLQRAHLGTGITDLLSTSACFYRPNARALSATSVRRKLFLPLENTQFSATFCKIDTPKIFSKIWLFRRSGGNFKTSRRDLPHTELIRCTPTGATIR